MVAMLFYCSKLGREKVLVGGIPEMKESMGEEDTPGGQRE
jgi:hypothetical protein